MANQEQVERLKQGVGDLKDIRAWNRWRSTHPEIQLDLSKADLSDAILDGIDLSRADLSDANLSGADLDYASLENANLTRANLTCAYLLEADLSNAKLCNADLSEANLQGANLSNANLSEANLTDTILSGACLDQIVLEGARLERTDLRDIPWRLVEELTLQPGVIWNEVRYDPPAAQCDDAEQP